MSKTRTVQRHPSSVLEQTEKGAFVYTIRTERVFHLEFQTRNLSFGVCLESNVSLPKLISFGKPTAINHNNAQIGFKSVLR